MSRDGRVGTENSANHALGFLSSFLLPVYSTVQRAKAYTVARLFVLSISKAYEGEETFKAEVADERNEQEQREMERRRREEAAKQRAQREAEDVKARASEEAMLAASKAEEERRKAVKARIKAVATTPKNTYEPQQRRKAEAEVARDAEREAQEAKEAEKRAKEAEQAKKTAAKEKKKSSEQKANKFLRYADDPRVEALLA